MRLCLLTVSAVGLVRTQQVEMVDTELADATQAEVGRCCCSAQEPTPKYVCANLKTNKLYLPAIPETSVPKAERLKGLASSSQYVPHEFHSRVFATSHCEKDKAVDHDLFGLGEDKQDPFASALEVQPGTEDGEEPVPAWFKPEDAGAGAKPEGAVSAATNIPDEMLTAGPVTKIYARELTAEPVWGSNATPPAFTMYEFGTAKRYKKYSTWKGYKSENLKAKHIEYRGVIYGPTDAHKESPSVHGMPVCELWEKAAEIYVKGTPSYDEEANTWKYKTSCKEHLLCRQHKISHACGFDHEDAVLLKRVGRRGECRTVSSSFIGGTHCPSGEFHNHVATKAGMGGTTWKFCDCRSDISPSGECSAAEAAAAEAKRNPPAEPEDNPFASGTSELEVLADGEWDDAEDMDP